MQVTDPRPFLEKVDVDFFEKHRGFKAKSALTSVAYVEPCFPIAHKPSNGDNGAQDGAVENAALKAIKSRVVRLGDSVDTDAVSTVL